MTPSEFSYFYLCPLYSLLLAQKPSDRLYPSAQGPPRAPHFTHILIRTYKVLCLLLFPHLHTLAFLLLDLSTALSTYLCLDSLGIISLLKAFLPELFSLPRTPFLQTPVCLIPSLTGLCAHVTLPVNTTLTTLFKNSTTLPLRLYSWLLFFA